jgi:predicted outer membrane repeat protein
LGTTYDEYTTIVSGTSMACPYVAGVAGLLLAGYPDSPMDVIVAKLVGTADDISQVNPGYEGLLGSGRVNAYEALASGTPQGGFEGQITLDKNVYRCDDVVSIELLDLDIGGAATQAVTVTTDGGDEETVILVPEVNEPRIFVGEIISSGESVVTEDGVLQISHGQVISVAYYDLDYGTGNPGTVEAAAATDCQGPVIFDVQVERTGSVGALITFETDEPATAVVRGGTVCGGPYSAVAESSDLATSHTVVLTGFASETDCYFIVEANDVLGNENLDDNGGQCYWFTTTEPVPIGDGLVVPNEYPTIQAAIDAAVDGNTVWVAPGVYTGDGNRDIDFRGKAIAVRGVDGPYFCVIDCQGELWDKHRAFNFVGGEGPDSVLDGLTIINGLGPIWGYFHGFYYDYLEVGGAIYCGESSPTITNCVFRNNKARNDGGALFCHSSSPTITNCVFENSHAHRGGAIYTSECATTITDCTFTGNVATQFGGAIRCAEGSPKITNCIISNNQSYYGGGGIYSSECSLITIANCVVSNNLAYDPRSGNPSSGGIMCDGDSEHTVRVVNCTVANNTSEAGPAGIRSDPEANNIISNCIIRGNYPGQLHPTLPFVTYCNVQDGWAGAGNIDADPCFVDANSGDYHLTEDSLCIDAGTNQPGGGLPVTDFEGTPRPLDGDDNGNSVADMGAYEYWNDSPRPVIEVSPGEVQFSVLHGEGNPDDQVLSIRNWGRGTLVWQISEDCPWLQVTPLSGESEGDFNDVVLSVDVTGMAVGYYSCVLTISAAGADNSPRPVDVHLDIQQPILVLDRNERVIYCGTGLGGAEPLQIRNGGSGTLLWQITEDCPWLELVPSAGQSTGETDYAAMNVDCNIAPGEYTCTFTVSAEGAQDSPQTVSVRYRIWGPLISVSPDVCMFSVGKESPVSPEQIMSIWNTRRGVLDWQITVPGDCDWLEVYPLSGQSTQPEDVTEVMVSVDASGLDYGLYPCELTIRDPNANLTTSVPVYLGVLRPVIDAQPSDFQFLVRKDGPNPPVQTLSIRNTLWDTLNWQITIPPGFDWLEVHPLSGQSTGPEDVTEVVLGVDANGLDYGSYTCVLTISDPNAENSPQMIAVNLVVFGPLIDVQPTEFEFFAVIGTPSPPGQVLSIRNTGYDTLNWQIVVSPGCNWLQVDPSSGTSTGDIDEVVVSVDAAVAPWGEHSCLLTVSCPDALNSPVSVQVNLVAGRILSVPTPAYPTIQAAIYTAGEGDTVLVADGTYTGQGNRDIDFGGKVISVRSENGPENCIIDCQGTQAEPHRAFYFHSGEGPSSVLQGFTITNGYAPFGAGILNENSSPTISDCVFNNNSAAFGAGLYNEDCSATVVNCIFSNNQATFDGAGVDNEYGSPKLINCTFCGNTAGFSGGAVLNHETLATITNCIMWGGTPEEIFVDGGSTTVSYSDVEGGFTGEGNIDTDPCFADAGSGDYHLLPDSPAIDAGDLASDWIYEPWPNGFRVNMGAYGNTAEATRSPADFEDLRILCAYWLTDEPLVDIAPEPDGDGIANFLDFAALANLWRWEQ